MRNIIFRGRSISHHGKKEEWVYGFYSNYKGVNGRTHYISDDNGNSIAVREETVGQYTGLTDKNGTKIFEGDCLTNVYLNPKNVAPLHIHFDEYCACYRAGRFQIDKNCCLNYTIIGNIYDNPELLY